MWIFIALAVVAALLILFAVVSYNGLVGRRNKIENAYSQIDVQLNRRHDLIPNLVETVKGYATHERSTLDAVITARNNALQAKDIGAAAAAENQLSGALASVFALAEAYPDLKANTNFQQLQTEMTETEDRIAYSRQYYNDTVRSYNESIEKFPGVVLARAMDFQKRQYFEVDPVARGGVDVSFD